MSDSFEHGHIQWASELVETLCLLGAADDARAIADRLAGFAATTNRPIICALAARAAALTAPADDCVALFEQALEAHRSSARPFEQTRTELCFGERLRRSRRTADARRHLRAALATFERLGAAPWARRAGRELDAAGVRTNARRPQRSSQLTPQELMVALAVARGQPTGKRLPSYSSAPRPSNTISVTSTRNWVCGPAANLSMP